MDDLGDLIGALFEGLFSLFGMLFGGVFELFAVLIVQVIIPLFQLWFSSVWSFLTGSGILGAIGFGIYRLLTH